MVFVLHSMAPPHPPPIYTWQSLMAHNEDNDPYLMNLGYFVHARITDASGAVIEEFTHYCYPGILCGDAYGFNSNGVVMTQNALFPSDVNLKTWAIRKCTNRIESKMSRDKFQFQNLYE